MSREFDVPIVKIHQKWGCDGNPTTMPCFGYHRVMGSQGAFRGRFFPHGVAAVGCGVSGAGAGFRLEWRGRGGIAVFGDFVAIIGKIFILAGGLGAGLSFYGV